MVCLFCGPARENLLIISTNPMGNNLTANVSRQMLCTLSNKIFINVLSYAYSIARNKLLITGECTSNYNYKSHRQFILTETDVVDVKNVTKS